MLLKFISTSSSSFYLRDFFPQKKYSSTKRFGFSAWKCRVYLTTNECASRRSTQMSLIISGLLAFTNITSQIQIPFYLNDHTVK